MDPLPYIDEHSRHISASADAIWRALSKVLRELPESAGLARVLGCDPALGSAEFAGRSGETLPGFRVVEAEPSRRLVLRGRHRFSNYELTFIIDGHQLRALTHAVFPGIAGRLYRAAVIGSGGHRLVVQHMLRKVARAAS
jgi:hypothetical protein